MDQDQAKSRCGVLAWPVVAAVSLVLLLLPSSAAAVGRSFFGIAASNHPDAAEFQTMGDARVGTFRFQLDWRRIQSTEGGPYNWSSADPQVEHAARNGIELLPVLYGSPDWAAGSYREPPLGSEADEQAWKDFLTAAVERYGPDGAFWSEHPDLPTRPARAWQVSNEQNSPTYWEPKPSPRKYAELLRASHGAISAADSGADIVLGGMFGTPSRNKGIYSWKFLKRLYGIKKAKRYFDAVALHPYSPNLAGIKAQVKLIRKQMKAARDPKTPIWVTEIGWGSANTKGQPLSKSRKGQKKMLRKSFNLLLDRRGKWKIRRIVWFTWRDPGDGEGVTGVVCGWCGSAGLLENDLAPKPSFDAFRRFTGAS